MGDVEDLFNKPKEAPAPAEDPKDQIPADDQPLPDDAKPTESNPDADLNELLTGEEKPKTEEKPKVEPKAEDTAPRTPKELRNAYERQKQEKIDLLKRNKELTERIASIEKNAPKAIQVEALAKENEVLKKQNDELQSHIRVVDYSKSAEYAEKYQAPLDSAVATAKDLVGMLKVNEPTEDGTPNRRQATWNDFAKLFNAHPGDLDEQAHAMFGASAPRVVAKIDEIKALGKRADNAVTESHKLATEHQNRQVAEQTANREKATRLYREAAAELMEKHPQFFKETDGDEEGNKMLRAGFGMVSRIYAEAKTAPMEKRVRDDAMLHLRAAAFGRTATKLQSVQKELEAAKAELASFKKTSPKQGPTDAPAPKVKPKTMEDAIDDIPSFRRA
jgi:hypothetical protein